MTNPELKSAHVEICSLCLSGVGGECHVPGCAFWMSDGPTPSEAEFLARLIDETGNAGSKLPRCNWCSKEMPTSLRFTVVGGLKACSPECVKHLEMIG